MAALVLAAATLVHAQDVVRVVDADGEPVPGARVQVMGWSDVGLDGPHATLVEQRAMTNAQGTASLRLGERGSREACLLAFDGTRAVFACHASLARIRAGGFDLTLGPARVLRGRVVDEQDKPLPEARLRLLFAGSYEMHGCDALVEEDGTFAFPPLPEDVIARGLRLEARAPGKAPLDRELGKLEDLVVRVGEARRLTGRIVDPQGKPLPGVELWIGSWVHARTVKTGADGSFAVDGAPVAACVLQVVPPQHAPRAVAVPAGEGARDLGAVAVAAGRPVTGRVREFDDAKIRQAFVALEDADGQRVRSAEIGPGGAFTLPAVGEGPHTLDCWVHRVEGVGGSRHLERCGIRAGGPPLDLVVPEGVRLRFRGADGKPCAVHEATLRIDSPAWKDTYVTEFQAYEGPVDEVRLLLGANLPFTLRLAARGYEEVSLEDLLTDGEGQLMRDAVLARKPGEPLQDEPGFAFPGAGPPAALPPPRFGPTAPKPDVLRHVRTIIAGATGRNSWSTTDPEVWALEEVGPAHLDVLVQELKGMQPGDEARSWVLWAVEALANEKNKDLILRELAGCRDLAGCVARHHWAEDARKTLLMGLRKEPDYLPTAWIDAVAQLRDPATYDLLLRYLAEGGNPHMTWASIRDLPGLDATRTVAEAWRRPRGDRWDREMFATVAVEFGHVDALGVLVWAYANEDNTSMMVRDKLFEHIEFRGTPAEILDWFRKYEQVLVFDRATGLYRPAK